jgi:hypothetical protein
MFASAILAAVVFAASFVVADPVPLEPDSTSVFDVGANCTILWTPDSTGKWTTMYIELMTGDNESQVHLKTVATVDGTSTTDHSFSYPCLSVTPNAAIYFYKFTSPAEPTVALFTTRFTIAAADGSTTTPTQTETGSTGSLVPWGTGALTDPSQGDQPPNLGNGNGTSTTNPVTSMPSNSSIGIQTGISGPTVTMTGLTSTTATSTSSHTNTNAAGLQALPSLALGLAGAFTAVLFL